MKSKRNDNRSVRKTKAKLKKTLVDLLKNKPIQKIKVSELAKKADINRGTFYFHYSDIYELLSDIEDDVFEEFEIIFKRSHILITKDSSLPLLESIFTSLIENSDNIYLLLHVQRDPTISKRINDWASYQIKPILEQLYPHLDSSEYPFISTFIIRGVLGTFEIWYSNGKKETPKELTKLVGEIIIKVPTFIETPEENI